LSDLWVSFHNDPETANLGVVEFSKLPFQVHRIYWISSFKPDAVRGLHAHKTLYQVLILISGSITIELYKGVKKELINMSSSSRPLLIDPGTWRVMRDASADAMLMVIASAGYDESDYIRDWDEYLDWFGNDQG
jgi:hypothetical protein